jgi:hypothetical protein
VLTNSLAIGNALGLRFAMTDVQLLMIVVVVVACFFAGVLGFQRGYQA